MRGFPSGHGIVEGNKLEVRDLVRAGAFWTMNQHAAPPGEMGKAPVLLKLKRGQTAKIAMTNKTAFAHPMHLHGHHFRVLTRNGAPAPEADVAPPSTPTAGPAASRSATPRSIWGSRKKLPATAPAAARVPAEGETEREEQD